MCQLKQALQATLIILIVGLYSFIYAQGGDTTANITGVVVDESDAVVVGAEITLRNFETNLVRQVISAEDGSFTIVQLPPSLYIVRIKAEGFKAQTVKLELSLGTSIVLNFKLTTGVSDDIVVVQANDIANETKTESSSNINRLRIDNLPINRRNFLDFTLTTARATMDRALGTGPIATSQLSFNGQPGRFNNITIDGLENNDVANGSVRSTFNQESIQEFQVVSDGFSAEFGRALGGIVNIVTRKGSNDFHSGLFLFNRNDKISARDTFSLIKPPFKQYQFGTVINGPIKKEKSFYFASFERLSIKQNAIVTISDEVTSSIKGLGFDISNGPVPFAIDTTALLGRFDISLTTNDSLFLRYNFNGSYNGNFEGFGANIAQSNSSLASLNDNSFAVTNTYINSQLSIVNETRFLYGRRDQDVFSYEKGPRVQIETPTGLAQFGLPGLTPQPRLQSFYQIADNLAYSKGNHQIKVGVDFDYSHADKDSTRVSFFAGGTAIFSSLDFSDLLGSPGLPVFSGLQAFDPSKRTAQQLAFLQFLTVALPGAVNGFPQGVPLKDLSLPLVYAQGFGDTSVELGQKQFGIFFQDDIRIKPNLILKAGLRYDINRELFAPDNNGNFSPRISFSYRPSFLPRISMHASYGLFFGNQPFGFASVIQLSSIRQSVKIPAIVFPFSILPFSLPGHHFAASEQLPPGVTFTPQLSSVFKYEPNLRNSYTQQINIGFDYVLGKDSVISATYNFVRGIKLFGLRNINPVVRPTSSLLNNLLTGRVVPSQGDIFEYESAFDSYYHGLTLSFNKRLSTHYSLFSHYTFSKAIDNYPDAIGNQLETNNSLNIGDERGLSIQDVRSRFVASGIWDLNYTKNRFLRDFQLSTIITLESGRPFNLIAGIDLNNNGDNPPGDRPLGIARNSGLTPGFANIDLRLTRNLIIRDRYRMELIAEVFNIINHVNISDIDRSFPPDANGNFHLPGRKGSRFIVNSDHFRGAFSPRQCQFGFKIAF